MELQQLILIAREAGEILARSFGNKELTEVVGIGHSGDQTLRADRVAEEVVLKRMKGIGDLEIVSEEAGRIVYGTPKHRIFLDPLDGSSNYTRSIPLFAVSIEVRTLPANEPAMAVIYEPIYRRTFSAERGRGAFLENSRIHTNHERRLEDCLFDLDLHLARNEEKYRKFVEHFEKFGLSLKSFRSIGSCAVPLAYTACGRLDGFLDLSGNSRMVDIAAGLMILQEAGGVATDIHGQPIKEPYDSVIACSTEEINRKIRELLSS